jgi:hypothetical protein
MRQWVRTIVSMAIARSICRGGRVQARAKQPRKAYRGLSAFGGIAMLTKALKGCKTSRDGQAADLYEGH